MEQKPIFIFMSDEIQAALNDNGINVVKELRRTGVEVTQDYAPNPATGAGNQKDATLIILAAAPAFASVAWGIARIIDALGRNKKVVVRGKELVPVRDESGNVVRDANKQPVLYWTETAQLIEPSQTPQDSSRVTASLGPQGISFELVSGKDK